MYQLFPSMSCVSCSLKPTFLRPFSKFMKPLASSNQLGWGGKPELLTLPSPKSLVFVQVPLRIHSTMLSGWRIHKSDPIPICLIEILYVVSAIISQKDVRVHSEEFLR